MPRRQKSKCCARVKRHQTRGETQSLKGAEAAPAAAAAEEESPSSPSSVSQGAPPSSPAAGTRQRPQAGPAPSSPEAGVSRPGAEAGAQSQDENGASASQAAPSTQSTRKDPLTRKASMLVQFLLEKYKMKEPIMQTALLKIINKKYKEHFPEILRRASERMELIFGLELKEVNRSNHTYTLVSKLSLPSDGGHGGQSDERGLPSSGLLMTLLGVIFMKGNRATEEEVWEFLNTLGVYAGRRHLIFGEPRRLITKDLVQQKYLKYRQVPHSDPPHHEFLWGPRAHAETTKMKVLEVLAKINDTVPSAFPNLYEEALKDEEERAGVRAEAKATALAEARAPSRAKSRSSTHI